ncbi:glycosyltransferase family 2 protein [Lacinutrix algicola]|uniref:glycosyltransferase family 2 protein n=1 Tax=Lacinutrix algicola TaxID=342954 RepID=UPI0006E44DD0|nr:glycosyltransferase family 2 protein [Lacinutrix algicola]
MQNQNKIAVVIPYYNASNQIVRVLEKLPEMVTKVYIIDDCSPQALPEAALSAFSNLEYIKNEKNLGVGGATKIGFIKAIEDKMEFVVKVDADDQMDTTYIKDLIAPLVNGEASYAKGNRFRDFKALKKMPFTRKVGNLGLSFLTKAATGYWNNFDPTNGFFAIKTDTLKDIDFDEVANRYYFETSLISQLYFQNIVIKDVAMPAIYEGEKSNMNVWQMPFVFVPKLIKTFLKRLFKSYFVYDFNISSVYLLIGTPLFLFGFIYGIYTWWFYSSQAEFAPTGTIMLVTLTSILGFQLLLQAVHYDITKAPKAK